MKNNKNNEPTANDSKPSPDWIAKAAKDVATDLFPGLWEAIPLQFNKQVAIIRAAIERNAKP